MKMYPGLCNFNISSSFDFSLVCLDSENFQETCSNMSTLHPLKIFFMYRNWQCLTWSVMQELVRKWLEHGCVPKDVTVLCFRKISTKYHCCCFEMQLCQAPEVWDRSGEFSHLTFVTVLELCHINTRWANFRTENIQGVWCPLRI